MLYNDFINSFDDVLKNIKDNGQLIHCITNPISINDCANAVLALGARPIMAEHPMEVFDITKTADALCLNIANITDARMESIKISAKAAYDSHIPFILDVVGITCSDLRFKYVHELLDNAMPTVIKGNLSEIKKLANVSAGYIGIDSTENIESEDDLIEVSKTIKKLAADLNCVIAASGRCDIISDGSVTAVLNNGSALLPKITGTGCMLNVIIGTMLAASMTCYNAAYLSEEMLEAILGTAILGVCGELAEAKSFDNNNFLGLGTYHVNLINELSIFTSNDIKAKLQLRFL